MRRSLRRANRGVADTYTLSLMRHGVETTEHDIAWLEALIAAERAGLGDPVAEPDGARTAAPVPVEPAPTEATDQPELQAK